MPTRGANRVSVGGRARNGRSSMSPRARRRPTRVTVGYLDEGGSVAYSGGLGMAVSGGEPVARVGVTFRLF